MNLPIELLASQYGVEADPDKVAEAVAADYPAENQEAAKAGCLAVLEEGGRGGTSYAAADSRADSSPRRNCPV